MTVNNQYLLLFVSMTQEKYVHWTWTTCYFTWHVNWTIFPKTPSGTWLEVREADVHLAYKLVEDMPINNGVIYLFGYVTWSSWQVCFDTFTVCCDLWFKMHSGSVHISLVSIKQTLGYWLSVNQYIGVIL